MKTKRFVLAMAVIAFIGMGNISAQNVNTNKKERKYTTEELVEMRTQRMQSMLKMDDATTAKFTPIYKAYIEELKACRTSSLECMKKAPSTDAERMARMEEGFKCREKMLETQKLYFNKFKKILNAEQLECIFGNHRKGGFHNYGKGYKHRQSDTCDFSRKHHQRWHEQCKH